MKKFDLKLTAFLVSLFIGLLLIILGSKNEYCLSFGLIVTGCSLGVYALYKTASINKLLEEIEQEIEEVDVEDSYTLKQLIKMKSRLKKQRRSVSIVFYLTAVLLIVLGVSNML